MMPNGHQATAKRTPDRGAPAHSAAGPEGAAKHAEAGTPAGAQPTFSFTPVAYMVGQSIDDVRLLSAVMDGVGIEYKAFENGAALSRGWTKRVPDLIVIDVSASGVDAVDTIFTLAERNYTGALLFTADRANAAIDGLVRVAQRHELKSLPAVKRPLERDALHAILKEQKTAVLQSGPSRIRLDEGLKNHWIDFWYQPKIDLRNRTLVGVESFVRLFHPQIGLVPPAVFLADADETSHFILGQRALVHAVKTASDFAELGLDIRVAINLSVKALRTLPVSRIIRTNHVSTSKPLKLTFDVSETDIVADPSFISQRVKLLRTLGVNLAIDDFQSDGLSQNDLKAMAPSELKIPRLFVAGSDGNSTEAMICKSIIDVAHKLQARAVAIGIERLPQIEALEKMGCDVGQGFLFGQPMPNDQIVPFMRLRTAPETK
jgi:EAL domain-containing protein (putative c-di-GMP-specific phosphodiesterase class I)